MTYILLAFIFYAIILNCMAITMVRTLKRSKQADTRQIEHCRACNVLLINHNHSCHWDDLKQVPIQAEINIREEFSMLKEYVTTDTSTLSEIEQRLLLDYFRYREVVNELKANYPELAKQYIVEDKPTDELCYCDKCEQNFEESEMDNGNCPFCGSRIIDEPIEPEYLIGDNVQFKSGTGDYIQCKVIGFKPDRDIVVVETEENRTYDILSNRLVKINEPIEPIEEELAYSNIM